MKRKILGALLAVLAMAGCAEMKELDDWAMKKAHKGRPAPTATAPDDGLPADFFRIPKQIRCAHSPAWPESENCCGMDYYMTDMDIDAAYQRADAEFHFARLPYDLKRLKQPHRDDTEFRLWVETNYTDIRFPGQRITVGSDVVPRSYPQLSQGFFLIYFLEKMGKRTRVGPAYCEIPGLRAPDQVAWHKAIQAAVLATIPPSTK